MTTICSSLSCAAGMSHLILSNIEIGDREPFPSEPSTRAREQGPHRVEPRHRRASANTHPAPAAREPEPIRRSRLDVYSAARRARGAVTGVDYDVARVDPDRRRAGRAQPPAALAALLRRPGVLFQGGAVVGHQPSTLREQAFGEFEGLPCFFGVGADAVGELAV